MATYFLSVHLSPLLLKSVRPRPLIVVFKSLAQVLSIGRLRRLLYLNQVLLLLIHVLVICEKAATVSDFVFRNYGSSGAILLLLVTLAVCGDFGRL